MRPFRFVVGLTLLLAGCADGRLPAADDTEPRRAALLDDGGPNWMVVGGAGRIEMAGGTDGEPDQLSGRFVLEGSTIIDVASGADRWIAVGPGRTQALGDDGLRLSESRDALSGDTIGFIEPGPSGWLIAGSNGRAQLLDVQGEPTATTVQVLANDSITAGAHNGINWLLGGAMGNVVVVNSALGLPASPEGNPVDGSPIRAIVGDPAGGATPAWLAFTDRAVSAVTGVGTPGAAANVLTAGTITTAEFAAGKVFVGTSDGRVGVAAYSATPSFTFTNVVGGAAVTRLVTNGSEWLALGANGQAQRFDTNGAVIGGAVQIASRTDRPLTGAHWTGTRWLIAVGSIGLVAFVDDALSAPRTLTPVLGGRDIRDASANGSDVLVVGTSGMVQRMDTLGNPIGSAVTVSGSPDLNAVSWNGNHWLVAGNGGVAQVIDADGAAVGAPTSLLGGQDIRFISWSGEFFLIGGGGGMVQVVRADGTQSSPAFAITGATDFYAAQWSGLDWLAVGTDGSGGAFVRLVATDMAGTATTLADTGALRAVDFNGLEFLAGGDGGLIQRIGAQGMTVDSPVDVLTGFDIHDVAFNGVNYIVVGEFGALRRLGQDYLPLRTPIAMIDRETAAAVVWTTPRGFANGSCITNELCYAGPCVGGLAQGRCCDSACDRACESCFEDHTGEPDGTCAPVVAGKQPPFKVGSSGCDRQAESTCGLTGSCNGAGECQFYGADIQCEEALCSLGQFTPATSCSGAGTCAVADRLDCAPYAGCTVEGCVTTCNANTDCVDTYECVDSACVLAVDDTPLPGGGDDNGDGGCCATTAAQHPSGPATLLLASLWMVRRRKRVTKAQR